MVWRVHRQKIILYCVMQLTGKAAILLSMEKNPPTANSMMTRDKAWAAYFKWTYYYYYCF